MTFDYRCLEGQTLEDGAATLVHFTATSIARAADWFPERPKVWILCGGGRRNGFLVEKINRLAGPAWARKFSRPSISASTAMQSRQKHSRIWR